MEVLLHNSEKAVTREALLDEVWGADSDSGSNVVDVIVSALRRKMPDNAGRIETVRGLGYRYLPPVIAAAS